VFSEQLQLEMIEALTAVHGVVGFRYLKVRVDARIEGVLG
jgi:hypothetical protein